jgi:hypothetical protein
LLTLIFATGLSLILSPQYSELQKLLRRPHQLSSLVEDLQNSLDGLKRYSGLEVDLLLVENIQDHFARPDEARVDAENFS